MPRRKLTHLNSSPNSGKVVGFVEMNNPADKVWKKAVHSLAAQRYYVQAREMHTHKFARDVNDAVASGRSSPEDRESDESGPRSESGRMARSGQERWFFASCTHSTYHDERSRLVLNAGASKSSLPFDRGVAQELDPLTVLGRPPDRFQDYLFNHCMLPSSIAYLTDAGRL